MTPLQRLRRKGLTISRPASWAVEEFIPTPGEYFPTDLFPTMTTGVTDGTHESIGHSYGGYVNQAYKSNGIVFACVLARMMPFSEARFQFQRLEGGRPGDLWGDESLSILERPWPSGTTGELLARMEQDVSLAGNFYATIVGEGSNRRIRRLRPDWVTVVSGVRGSDASPYELDADVLGYIYAPKPHGTGQNPKPVVLSTDRVVHWSPIPDPAHQWRGMSWLTPVLREIEGDSAATLHKLKFFENGATFQTAISYDAGLSPEAFAQHVKLFKESHEGLDNAYKTLHLGGGAEPTVLSADMKQLDFKATQGAGETRIAAASGVGAIIAQFSEGMQGSSLNAGNYGAAKRRVSDMHFRPMWRSASAALEKFAPPPSGSRLWYDDRDIAFLKEDAKDAAEIEQVKSATIRQLVDGGFRPDTVVAAVQAQNMGLLEHTGKLSVQLQEPGETEEPPDDAVPAEV